jgi:hypothetical protein
MHVCDSAELGRFGPSARKSDPIAVPASADGRTPDSA